MAVKKVKEPMMPAGTPDAMELKPNFEALRQRFERNAEYSADSIARCMKRGVPPTAGDMRNLVVYLNIALQSVDTTKALEAHRAVVAKIASQIADADDKFREGEQS